MSNFDKNYIFRIAQVRDKYAIMNFIKEHWDSNHILGNHSEFFEYEHRQDDQLNFVIAISRKTLQIEAIQGFIPYTKKTKAGHVCGVISCVSKVCRVPLLGIETMRRMIFLTQPSSYCGIGTNPKTMLPLVKRIMKRHVGKMEHYYKVNEFISEFKIALICNTGTKMPTEFKYKNKEVFFKELYEFDEVERRLDLNKRYKFRPFKDKDYIRKRYFNHPIYTYRFFVFFDVSGFSAGLLVGRTVHLNDAKILRFVDFLGDTNLLSLIGQNTDRLIKNENLEYIDILCTGINSKILKMSGFTLKTKNDNNIIPIYFEPFVRNNVDIYFEASYENMVLFKADADQDRPRFF